MPPESQIVEVVPSAAVPEPALSMPPSAAGWFDAARPSAPPEVEPPSEVEPRPVRTPKKGRRALGWAAVTVAVGVSLCIVGGALAMRMRNATPVASPALADALQPVAAATPPETAAANTAPDPRDLPTTPPPGRTQPGKDAPPPHARAHAAKPH
jgi:hypothetical protein